MIKTLSPDKVFISCYFKNSEAESQRLRRLTQEEVIIFPDLSRDFLLNTSNDLKVIVVEGKLPLL